VGAPQTHGKGTSQEVAPLTGNLFLKLTSRIFTSPSGRSPQIQGVVPGIIIEDQPELTIPLEKDSLSPLQPMTAPNAIEPQDRLENEISPELTRTLGERSRARQQSWAFESPNGPAQRTQDRRGLNERKFVQNTEESLQIMRDWLDLISGH
jgi:hypothetical protein